MIMSPRIVVWQGAADLPQTLSGSTVWTSRHPITVGGFSGYEYRRAGFCIVVVTVAAMSGRTLSVAWIPATARKVALAAFDTLRDALVTAGLVVAGWDVEEDLTVPALDAASGTIATAVRTNWPATWRVRQAGDAPGSFSVAQGLPTGARFVGVTL